MNVMSRQSAQLTDGRKCEPVADWPFVQLSYPLECDRKIRRIRPDYGELGEREANLYPFSATPIGRANEDNVVGADDDPNLARSSDPRARRASLSQINLGTDDGKRTKREKARGGGGGGGLSGRPPLLSSPLLPVPASRARGRKSVLPVDWGVSYTTRVKRVLYAGWTRE